MKAEYEAMLALKPYLDPKSADKLEQMVKDEENINDINVWVNNVLTNRQIKTARTIAGDEAKKEYKEYEHLLNEDELRWIKKFYCEMYDNGVHNIPEDFRLLKTEEMIKESNRHRNNSNNDIYEVSARQGTLLELDENRYEDEDLEYGWEQVYSCFGHEPALNCIIDECLDELSVKNFDKRLSLVRFYIKMNRLRLSHNRDRRNKKRKE